MCDHTVPLTATQPAILLASAYGHILIATVEQVGPGTRCGHHNGDLILAPPITVGTPPKTLDALVLDAVAGPSQYSILAGRNAYDGAGSSSASRRGTLKFTTTHRNGSVLHQEQGQIYADTVSLGAGLPAAKLPIVNVDNAAWWSSEQGRFNLAAIDMSDASRNWTEPAVGFWFAQPGDDGSLPSWEAADLGGVAVYMKNITDNAGGITYGGVDDSRFHGPLVPVPTDHSSGFAGVTLNGSTLELPSNLSFSSPMAIRTVAVTFLPPSVGQALFKALGGRPLNDSTTDEQQAYILPCDIKGTVGISIGGTVLNASRLLIAKTDDGQCVSSIMVWRTWPEILEIRRKRLNRTDSGLVPDGEPPFMIGLGFLRSVYTKMTLSSGPSNRSVSYAFAPVVASQNASVAPTSTPKSGATRASVGATLGVAGAVVGLLGTVL